MERSALKNKGNIKAIERQKFIAELNKDYQAKSAAKILRKRGASWNVKNEEQKEFWIKREVCKKISCDLTPAMRQMSNKNSTFYDSEKLSIKHLESLRHIDTGSTKKDIAFLLRTISMRKQIEARKSSNNLSFLYGVCNDYKGYDSIAEESHQVITVGNIMPGE